MHRTVQHWSCFGHVLDGTHSLILQISKGWCVLNFGCQFYVISCASALAVYLYIEIALQKRSSGCSSEIQIYGKNMVRPVNERSNQEGHVKSQTSENSLSSKFGDDAQLFIASHRISLFRYTGLQIITMLLKNENEYFALFLLFWTKTQILLNFFLFI